MKRICAYTLIAHLIIVHIISSNLQAQEIEMSTQNKANGYFGLARRDSIWTLIDPQGFPFFSIGLNHIDPATLRYIDNIHIWEEKYNSSTLKWLQESVKPNLLKWGFNTIGWEQEVTVMHWQHSRAFTNDELRVMDMPYCRMLPFSESHQWEKHTVHYDYFSKDWLEWVDYVARAYCAEVRNDPNLIGYFYSDCPTWIHTNPQNEWRGPIFDPTDLNSIEGHDRLYTLAKQYYRTIHDAIRKYDPNHLILGDRFEANAPIAMEVINAALPYIDVLSFQDFKNPAVHLKEWHEKTGKPVLLADGSGIIWEGDYKKIDGKWYEDQIKQLFDNPGCIGFHLCGAYQRNRARRKGLLDEQEVPDSETIQIISEINGQLRLRILKYEMSK